MARTTKERDRAAYGRCWVGSAAVTGRGGIANPPLKCNHLRATLTGGVASATYLRPPTDGERPGP